MRSLNAARNMLVSTVAQIFSMLLSFVSRTIFIKLLATEYLGLSGLFANILSVLSLSELGIGNAIIINIYKPLAEKDETTICRYMNFYAKTYRIIGLLVMLFGILSTPFLQYLVNTDIEIPNLKLIYFLFVANSALSYFFAYKRNIFTADQKEYVNTVNRNLFLLLQYLFQSVVLLLTHSYILYVVVMLLCTLTSNLSVSVLAKRQYPFLKDKNSKLNSEQKTDLLKSIKALLLQKIGNVLVNSTDNIILSVFLGVYFVGLYSNYSLIVSTVTAFALIIFAACSSGIGNLNAVSSTEKFYHVFKSIMFISLWVFGFCGICLICLFQPFVMLWIGEQYLLDFITVSLIVLAFFLKGIINVTGTFVDATKLFVNTRWVSIVMAVINLVVSIVAVKCVGVAGVFIGTIVSYITTSLWINPLVLYKNRFARPVIDYVSFMLPRLLVILVAGGITFLLTQIVTNFVLKVLICGLIPNLIMLIVWHRTTEFQYLYGIVRNLLKRGKG